MLQPPANATNYLVRAYSGGLADLDELQNVIDSKYANSPQLGSSAFGVNLLQGVFDLIDFSTLGIADPLTGFFTCELTSIVSDVVTQAGP